MGWQDLRGLCHAGASPDARHRGAIWENLDLRPPPGPDETLAETRDLLRLQGELKTAVQAARRDEIVAQAAFGIEDYLSPLGIDEAGGFEATRALIAIVLEVSNEVGLAYKARFGRPRPNIVQPMLRPFIAVPAHASYPSNHSYQSFAVAEVMARLHPEHPGSTALYHRAQRIAENREWAGLHYRSDTQAGRDLARQTVAYLTEALDGMMDRAQSEWLG